MGRRLHGYGFADYGLAAVGPACWAPGVSNTVRISVAVDSAPAHDHIKELILLSSPPIPSAATVTADKDAFTYYAPNDGLYWLGVIRR